MSSLQRVCLTALSCLANLVYRLRLITYHRRKIRRCHSPQGGKHYSLCAQQLRLSALARPCPHVIKPSQSHMPILLLTRSTKNHSSELYLRLTARLLVPSPALVSRLAQLYSCQKLKPYKAHCNNFFYTQRKGEMSWKKITSTRYGVF